MTQHSYLSSIQSLLDEQSVARRWTRHPVLWFVVGFLAAVSIWSALSDDPPAIAQPEDPAAVQEATPTETKTVLARTESEDAGPKEADGPLGEGEETTGGIDLDIPNEPVNEPNALSQADTTAAPLPSFHELEKSRQPAAAATDSAVSDPANESSLARTVKGCIQKNDTLSTSFDRQGLGIVSANTIMEALKGIFDFRYAQPGTAWEAKFNVLGELDSFRFHHRPLVTYYVRREGEGLQGYEITGETQMFVVPLAGTIEESLSQSIWKLGESDGLTTLLADIFAWDIDFYSDIRKGDSWRALVEKYYYNGKFVKYGRVLAASFKGSYLGDSEAYYFETADEKRAEYFDADGNSMQKSFLRAPLNTTRVTSRFGFRMHPTLHKYKKHNGVDYGAPIGTPIWAIAGGKVLAAGWMGACGKGIKLRHNSGYESIYCHLSSIAVRSGTKVRQKQMIGRVGNTGRSTGPHLHFGLKKLGQWVNPLKVKYEPGKALEKQYRDRWREARELLHRKLAGIELPSFFGPDLPPDFVDPTRSDSTPPTAAARRSPKRTKKSKKKGFRPRPEGIKTARDAG